MKKKLLVFLLAGLLCGSLSACTGNAAPKTETSSETKNVSETKTDSGKSTGGKKVPSYSVPQIIKDLSAEEEAAIVGMLKGSVYENKYFGFRLTVPEGWTLDAIDFDDSSVNPMSLTEMTGKGYSGSYFTAFKGDDPREIQILIADCQKEYQGLDEKAFVEKQHREMYEMYEEFGIVEDLPEIKEVTFAGEEHPAVYTEYEGSEYEMENYEFFFPKNGFYAKISVMVKEGQPEELFSFLEKI